MMWIFWHLPTDFSTARGGIAVTKFLPSHAGDFKNQHLFTLPRNELLWKLSKTAPSIFIFSTFMGAKHSFDMKFIAT